MKVYAISGLGADQRVFQFLKLGYEMIVIDWIKPKDNEGIVSYAMRLSEVIDQSEEYAIIGVSFGGLIAVEMSKKLNPKFTILISSAETCHELRWIYRIIGKTKLIDVMPLSFLKISKNICPFIFGANNKNLLIKIIEDTDLHFAKWSLREFMLWSNKDKIKNCFKINGTKDLLMPPCKLSNNDRLIQGGGHFMIVDKAGQVTEIIHHIINRS